MARNKTLRLVALSTKTYIPKLPHVRNKSIKKTIRDNRLYFISTYDGVLTYIKSKIGQQRFNDDTVYINTTPENKMNF